MISVDAYPFLAFSDLTCHLEDIRIGFSGCTVLPGSDQDASALASKNTRVVVVPCHAWKCAPTAISGDVDISELPGCPKSFVTTNEFSVRITKITSRICVS